MSGESESVEAARTVAERLAVVCRNLNEIRADLSDTPSGADAVDRVLEAARGSGNLGTALSALHAALQAADPHGLDGYTADGHSTRGPAGGALPAGTGRSRPGERVYLCPERRCTRYWWPVAAVAVPACAVTGTTMRRELL
ncbi:hypothetical protein ACF061_23955 [Streptomyces sp. NPDC015220]|uniref:hypothetical protein n=1 Tax=Streptomyces sp. NPDC015220 TaxID=3364947 RepID=UPI0036FEA46D